MAIACVTQAVNGVVSHAPVVGVTVFYEFLGGHGDIFWYLLALGRMFSASSAMECS